MEQAKRPQIATPKDFDSYLRVPGISYWLILISACCIVLGGLIWVFVGELPTSINSYAVARNGDLVVYIPTAQAEYIQLDTAVESEFGVGTITQILSTPISYQECSAILNSDYLLECVNPSDWNTVITIEVDYPLEENAAYPLTFITEKISPITFIY